MTWPEVTIARIAQEFISGGTPSTKVERYWAGDVPWITGADVRDSVVSIGRKWITREAVENSATNIVPSGAILLVSRTGVGKVARADADIAISQDLTGIVLKEGAVSDYVVAAIQHKVTQLQHLQQGAIIKGVLRRDIEQLRIPLPPLSEQRRIVEILEQADRLRRLRVEADAKADRILPAQLIRTFGNPHLWAADPKGEALGQLVKPISGGTPSKKDPSFWTGDVPWVSPKDMKTDFLFDSQDHISSAALEETNLSPVPEGSVLIVVRGMILARDVPVALNARLVTINQDMKALVPLSREVNGLYIWAALYLAKPILQSLVRTAGHGTRKLDTPDLMQFVIPRPDSSKLSRVGLIVESHRLAIDQRHRADRLLGRVFKVLLSKAFDGSLTAAWREAHMKDLLAEMEIQASVLEAAKQ